MRKLQTYVDRYGPEVGPRFFHLLQSQAAHAGVSARLRRKIAALTASAAPSTQNEPKATPAADLLPLFAEPACPIADPSVVG